MECCCSLICISSPEKKKWQQKKKHSSLNLKLFVFQSNTWCKTNKRMCAKRMGRKETKYERSLQMCHRKCDQIFTKSMLLSQCKQEIYVLINPCRMMVILISLCWVFCAFTTTLVQEKQKQKLKNDKISSSIINRALLAVQNWQNSPRRRNTNFFCSYGRYVHTSGQQPLFSSSVFHNSASSCVSSICPFPPQHKP